MIRKFVQSTKPDYRVAKEGDIWTDTTRDMDFVRINNKWEFKPRPKKALKVLKKFYVRTLQRLYDAQFDATMGRCNHLRISILHRELQSIGEALEEFGVNLSDFEDEWLGCED